MYLINVETMLLEEFFGNEMPNYAILSHTWGKNNEEVHFKDMGTKDPENKAGYAKIRHLCKQAAEDGLRWAWCDTCCIDKSSSSELSESINSMFQWYQNSNVCYAYLSDVSNVQDRQNAIEQISKSRWFTRGWTLQELLAPAKVRFYDRDWIFLGDKKSLCGLLQEITKVNFGAMTWPWTLPSYSIATRMFWASSRMTTRIEDRAYCMLGILGVHMPLLYGEGENAFRRLQEELIKISDDETIFAHSGRNILARCPQEFYGGHHLTVLKKAQSAPFSITNAGLHIYLRVLNLNANLEDTSGEEVSALGILNCHHNNDVSRNGYLALPLRDTAIDRTYRRAPTSIRWVDAKVANAAEYRAIFIQLKPAQVSRLTLLGDFDRTLFSSQVVTGGSQLVYNGGKPETRIYPVPPFEYESAFYAFQRLQNVNCQPFVVATFFDLIYDRAGLLLLPNYHSLDLKNCGRPDKEATFMAWKTKGQPDSAELYVASSDVSPSEKIRAAIIRKEEMKQFVWYLQVEVLKSDSFLNKAAIVHR
jgi:hypothetical protein